MRKFLGNLGPVVVSLSLMVFLSGLALAGDYGSAEHQHTSADMAAKTEMMKAEFAKCAVCKNVLPYWDTLLPSMNTEVVKLNNGYAMVQSTNDPNKVAAIHEMSGKCHTAGEAAMKFTEAEAKTKLCSYCQGIYGVLKSGATMSLGDTANGDMCIITSADPKVQQQIASVRMVCENMMSASN